MIFLTNNISTNKLSSWHRVFLRLPKNIYNFCRKYLILTLPAKASLKVWKIIESDTCDLRKQKSETQYHIVSNCQTEALEKHYTCSWLYTIANWMSLSSQKNSRVTVDDIKCFPLPGQLFTLSRYGFGWCFEANLIKSNKYKTMKYDDLCREVINKRVKLELFLIEISCNVIVNTKELSLSCIYDIWPVWL